MKIEDFALAWRWSRSTHAVLPPEVLATITPITAEQADTLYKRGEAVFEHEASSVRVHRASDENAARAWLSTLPFPEYEQTSIVWDRSTGVRLPWHSFVTYWDDFCYPSSDDAFLFAEGSSFALAWCHESVFKFRADTG